MRVDYAKIEAGSVAAVRLRGEGVLVASATGAYLTPFFVRGPTRDVVTLRFQRILEHFARAHQCRQVVVTLSYDYPDHVHQVLPRDGGEWYVLFGMAGVSDRDEVCGLTQLIINEALDASLEVAS